MPILIKNIIWTQSDDIVRITLKFSFPNGAHLDVFTSNNYLKVHGNSYFWEAFLLHSIDKNASKCQIFPGTVQFLLKKCEAIEWNALEKSLSPSEKTTIRNEAIQEVQQSHEKNIKEKFKYKEEKKREEILNATSRDAKVRDDYEKAIKQAVVNELSQNVEKIQVHSSTNSDIKQNSAVLEKVRPLEKENKQTENQIFIKPKPVQAPVNTPRPKSSANKILKTQAVPAVRKSCNISVSFTERNFITPKRESQAEEERAWLLKQNEVRKSIGFVEEDLRPDERNPQWLKEKGDTFFEQKNYLGALSAYSTAIKLTDQYWELFLNRSAAHFHLENFQRCIEDCTRAYELLTPACPSNLEARKNCLARQGAALSRLGLIKQAYDQLVAAVKLDPADQVLVRDAEMLRCKLENSS